MGIGSRKSKESDGTDEVVINASVGMGDVMCVSKRKVGENEVEVI